MLNTLFPPVYGQHRPTRQLTPAVLHEQRQTLGRYALAVEHNGPQVLDSALKAERNVRRGDETGWPGVHRVLDLYLEAANEFLEKCKSATSPQSISSHESNKTRDEEGVGESRKASRDNPRVSGSTASSGLRRPSTTVNKDKPLPAAPPKESTSSQTGAKGNSMFEKIARKFSLFGNRKRDETEKKEVEPKKKEIEPKKKEDDFKTKALRKMKSTGNLKNLKDRNQSSATIGSLRTRPGQFIIDEDLRTRAIAEARARTAAMQAAAGISSTTTPRPPVVSFEV